MSGELEQIQAKAEEQAIFDLGELDARDPEKAHGEADRMLLEFIIFAGFADVADAYESVQERASWWGTS